MQKCDTTPTLLLQSELVNFSTIFTRFLFDSFETLPFNNKLFTAHNMKSASTMSINYIYVLHEHAVGYKEALIIYAWGWGWQKVGGS